LNRMGASLGALACVVPLLRMATHSCVRTGTQQQCIPLSLLVSMSLQVREKIEMSGRDARWEFPKQLLFARTNYMAEICNDLIEMVEIVDDFFKFLGPELKAVTGSMWMDVYLGVRWPAALSTMQCTANPHFPW